MTHPLTDASRTAYASEVCATLFRTYGVAAPRKLDRLIAEAWVLRRSAVECVDAIGTTFRLTPLPIRRF